MNYVGLDFGTSNSSIARLVNGQIHLAKVDQRNFAPEMLRSLLYLARDYTHSVGTQAVQAYLENETGRPVYWESRFLGTIDTIWAGVPSTDGEPLQVVNEIIVDVDVSARGKLLYSLKTALRSTFDYLKATRPEEQVKQGRIWVFERLYPIEDLIGLIIGELRSRLENELETQVEGVVLGRPVRLTEDPQTDKLAEGKLIEAARLAGFKDIHVEMEPEAAALVYHRQVTERQNVLVFDFGGGTLDFTIMRVGGSQRPEVLATHGLLVGGNDLDRALIRPLYKYFGDGTVLRDGTPFPAHIMPMLNSWQTIVDLSRPRYREVFRSARNGDAPAAVQHLEKLVYNNLGFQLFQELEQTKIRLSSNPRTAIEFHHDGIEIVEPISRQQFHSLIRSELTDVMAGVDEVLRMAGLGVDDIQKVLRTGGSSAVPAFVEMLEKKFGAEKLHALSPFSSIVGGLAIRAEEFEGRRH